MTALQRITVKYRRVIHLFSANYRSAVILGMKYNFMPSLTVAICRKQVTDAQVGDIWFRYFHKKYRNIPIPLQRVPA